MNAVVLGGTHDHIELIKILKGRGYTVFLIDYYDAPIAKKHADYHIKGSTLDKDFVFQKCSEINAVLCLAFCIDQALLTMAYVSEKLNLPCHISYATALELTNKVLMKKKFRHHNIPSSDFSFLNPNTNVFDEIKHLSYPLVIKPADANSSKGIKKVSDKNELKSVVANAFIYSNIKEVVVEEFKVGIELSVDVIISDYDPVFVLITENVKRQDTPDNFTIVKNVFRQSVQNHYFDKIKLIAKSIAIAYDLKNSPLLIQLLVNANELNVIEFSARIGGGSKHHFIKKITNFDMLGCFLNIVTKDRVKIENKIIIPYASMNYVYLRFGTLNNYEGFEQLKNKKIIEDVYKYKTKGTEVSSSTASTDRPFGFMVVADSEKCLEEKTAVADNTIRVYNNDAEDIMIHGLYKIY